MTMMATTSVESGVLHANVSGTFALTEAEAVFLQILDAMARQRCDKALIDGQRLEGDLSTIQRFLHGSFAAAAAARFVHQGLVDRIPQFAYVLQDPILDPERFGETVAVNRGMWVKAFDDLAAARAWLEASMTQVRADGSGRA